jgi:hypothetical protein
MTHVVETIKKNQKLQGIKNHFKNNKKEYIVGGICLVTGALAGALFSKYSGSGPDVTQKVTQVGLINRANVLSVYINPLGDPGNVVQCLETGSIYASQGQAARELNLDPAALSKHLNGRSENVHGNHFQILGKAGQALAE